MSLQPSASAQPWSSSPAHRSRPASKPAARWSASRCSKIDEPMVDQAIAVGERIGHRSYRIQHAQADHRTGAGASAAAPKERCRSIPCWRRRLRCPDVRRHRNPRPHRARRCSKADEPQRGGGPGAGFDGTCCRCDPRCRAVVPILQPAPGSRTSSRSTVSPVKAGYLKHTSQLMTAVTYPTKEFTW